MSRSGSDEDELTTTARVRVDAFIDLVDRHDLARTARGKHLKVRPVIERGPSCGPTLSRQNARKPAPARPEVVDLLQDFLGRA
jgi:hypothetical protein